MKLPHFAKATVAQAKITQYLLNETHEDGRSKAAFFFRFGFSVTQWEVLQVALLAHASDYEVASVLNTAKGKHYAVEGELFTPSGRTPLMRSVWMLEHDSETPRFITAYPLKRRKDDSGT